MAEQLPMGLRVPASPPPARGLSAAPSGMEPPELREWLRVVRRRIRLTAGVTAATVAVAVFVARTTPPMYRATSVVRLVDARRVVAGDLAGQWTPCCHRSRSCAAARPPVPWWTTCPFCG